MRQNFEGEVAGSWPQFLAVFHFALGALRLRSGLFESLRFFVYAA